MDYEKLGAFYLGKEYDVAGGKLLDRLLMYDARDLTTHAVCVGMTGSGKTGLCINLLEEAAIDHVPAIIIDPKGDITNLLLTFPELLPGDFRPWINVDDARRKDLGEDEFAAQQAKLWREGLAQWGQDSTRILLLQASADFVVYTPGSDAGVPVSILQSFNAPHLDWGTEAELLREHIRGITSALLGLIGVDADPVRSREHILLSNLLEHFWRLGEDLDLPKLVHSIQSPPLQQLGVFDVETVFPEQDRFKLVMALNNLIAAPGFRSWLQGQPLDVAGFLATPAGKPRHSIFYISHLSDAERMFFVSILLNQVITWMRAQPGTTSLRALLYMDEIFGFFPPVANPPSKQPMLSLLKQARAYGLGIVLTTQNPADLDYKGLANAGTWFIGRLQTERDKKRLLDGLESASSAAGQALNRDALSSTISNLQKRVFLLHSIYEDAPVPFMTRWAMSYLRGPLTRPQVRQLMEERKPDLPAAAPLARTIVAPDRTINLEPVEAIAPVERVEPVVSGGRAVEPVQAMAPAERIEPAAPVEFAERVGDDAWVGPTRAAESVVEVAERPRPSAAPGRALLATPPPLPAQVQQVYLPVRRDVAVARQYVESKAGQPIKVQSQRLIYVPAVLGMGQVDFVDQRKGVYEQQRFALLGQAGGIGRAVWEQARPLDLEVEDLADQAEIEGQFVKLPETLDQSAEFTALKKSLSDYLYYNSSLLLLYSPVLDFYSDPHESDRDFGLRMQQAAREQRDLDLDDLHARYEDKLDKLWERLNRAEALLERKEADAKARGRESLISIGESMFGMFRGRRTTRGLSTYLSKRRQADLKEMEVKESEETVEALQQEIEELEAELEQEIAAVRAHWEGALGELEQVPIRPRRTDVQVELFALAWAPHWWLVFKQADGTAGNQLVPSF